MRGRNLQFYGTPPSSAIDRRRERGEGGRGGMRERKGEGGRERE